MKSVGELNEKQLVAVVANYRRKEMTYDPYYLEALEELARRKGAGLDFGKTLRAVLGAARERRFLSYKQLADESGLEWSRVRYAMNRHLGDLIEYAHRRGWPLLSAIVVNQQHLGDGAMEPSTLKGFCEAARCLGYEFDEGQAFLREQQLRVFEWAATFSPER